jgi:hypothetical protein
LKKIGCVIYYENITVVIAEGGQKAVNKFTDLMINKIDWNRKLNENDPEKDNKCTLIWQGVQRKRNFKMFKFQKFNDTESVKNYLKQHTVLHLWEYIINNNDDLVLDNNIQSVLPHLNLNNDETIV